MSFAKKSQNAAHARSVYIFLGGINIGPATAGPAGPVAAPLI